MDYDERYTMNEQGRHKECKCDICKKWFDEFDIETVDELQVCFGCNDLVMLRVEGFLRSASETVKQLVA